ncbi:MAG: ribosomal-processing cysteine protease Prp [Acutalibacteraceae bacterium]
MISVNFFAAGKGSARLAGFQVSGHSGIQGESIVCAAVSSACYMAANTITDVLLIEADISLRDGLMKLTVGENEADRAQVILQGLQMHLEQLAEQYPDKIRIQISEVQQ